MCYQRFMTYMCGCGTLEIDEPCEYATHPFSIRLDCPNYLSDSHRIISACSTEGFFCTKSKDAKYIYQLYQLRNDAYRKLQRLSAFQKACKQQLDVMRTAAQNNGFSMERLSTNAMYNETNSQWRLTVAQCNALVARGNKLMQSIQEVKLFYLHYGGPHSPHQGFSRAPSFWDVVGPRIPASISSSFIDVSRTGSGTQFPEDDNIVVKRPDSGPPAQEEVKHEEEQIPQSKGHPARVTNQPAPKRRGRKSLSPEKSQVEEELQAPRRSTRVSNKKINYEESDGSSPIRAVSPGESEVSGFTPSNRSDLSPSPDRSLPKRKRSKVALQSPSSNLDVRSQRGTANFGRMINDYRERLSRTSSPAGGNIRRDSATIPPTSRAGQHGNTHLKPPFSYHDPQSHRAFPSATTSTTAHSRPPTRRGPPNQQQPNASFNHFGQPAATPNFLSAQQVTQLAAQHAFTPMTAVHRRQYPVTLPELQNTQTNFKTDGQHTDRHQTFETTPRQTFQYTDRLETAKAKVQALTKEQVNSLQGTNNFGFIPVTAERGLTNTPYDQMKRSFSAVTDLTPPTVTNVSPPTTDPKKRKQPVSSPLLPNAKRPRLSFPGEELPDNVGYTTPTLLNQAPPRSSPSRIPSHAAAGPQHDLALNEQTEQLPTPAPNFAPTAIMYQPSLQHQHTVDLTIQNDDQTVQGGYMVDDYDDGFFDELIEEDKFSTELPDFIFG